MRRHPWLLIFLCLAVILPAGASAQTSGPPEPQPAMHDGKSLAEVARQLNNPVADLWALDFQFNRYYLQGDVTDRTREQDVLNFQPVLPVHLTKEWNLITRPVIPFVFSTPDFEPGKGWDDTSGLGDVANFGSNSITILKNDGTDVFTVFRTLSGFDGASALASGDWDDDGDLDLAVANFSSNTVAILTKDGTGNFSAGGTVSGMVGARALIAGDWDNDGDLDLAVGNSGANTVVILKNDGSGAFTPSSTIFGQTGVAALVSGDWDGDGDLDLAVANFSSNSIAVLRNNGTGSFSSLGAVGGQIGISGLAAGDWDGNGSLGLAAADNGSDSVHILNNQP